MVAVVAVAALAADQATKHLALRGLADGPVDLVWTLRLRLTFNPGASFGLGAGATPLLTAVVVVLVAGLVAMAGRVRSTRSAVGLGLLLGGAAGNLADRLLRSHGGAVVDFVDLQWWPVFNLADVLVFCGAALLVWGAAAEERATAPAGERAAGGEG